jgi:O-antigen ligase
MAALTVPAGEPAGAVAPGAVATAPSVLDRMRASGDAITAPFGRRPVALAIEIALLVTWFVLRTVLPADDPLLVAWAVAVGIVALLSPLSALVVIAGTAPFDEPFTVTSLLGLRMILVFVLGIGVAVRVAFRPRSMPWSWPVVLGGALLAGTLGSIGITYAKFGRSFAADSVEFWIAGVGGGLVVLLAATWVARGGARRPLVAAIGAASIAAAVTLVDHLAPRAVLDAPLAWMINAKDFGPRISGVIPSPNGIAALLLPPAMVLGAAVVAAPRESVRLRLLALAGLAAIIPVLYFTYSRAVLLAIFLFAAVAAWRFRRALGAVILVVGIVAGAALLPSYLALRESQAGAESTRTGTILVASDYYRFKAWSAAGQMFVARPLTGWGYRSYREIGNRYGDEALNSPHNEWLRLFAEQGIVGGLAGIAFVLTGLWRLAKVPGWFGTGVLTAFLSYVLAASFNNPLLFIQVSIIAFTITGTGFAWRPGVPAPGEAAEARSAA